MNKKLVFFLRAYNDIDHIVPVIYKWLSTENVPTDIIITSSRDYLNDYRIQFLRQFENLNVHFIDEFLPGEKLETVNVKSRPNYMHWYYPARKGYKLWRRFLHPFPETMRHYVTSIGYKVWGIFLKPPAELSPYHPARAGYKIWRRFFFSPPRPSYRGQLYDAPFVEGMLDALFEGADKGIVVFDWTYTDFVRSVVEAARNRGFTSISLPHGDRPHFNHMIAINDLDYTCTETSAQASMFDYTVVPNSLCAQRYDWYVESHRIKVLGSPRYNDEWLNIISTLVPAYHQENGDNKLKIAFFPRNFLYPIFWEEVVRTIRLLLQFPNVYLTIKHHTRSSSVPRLIKAYPELGADNIPHFESVYDDVHSGSLLEWADVVLDLGTSVAFEAVKRGKPVLAIEYVHANRSTVAHYMKSCDIQCRDDLYDCIQRFLQNGTSGFYDEAERQRFIAEMIDVPDNHVLDRYVQFLKSCF